MNILDRPGKKPLGRDIEFLILTRNITFDVLDGRALREKSFSCAKVSFTGLRQCRSLPKALLKITRVS